MNILKALFFPFFFLISKSSVWTCSRNEHGLEKFARMRTQKWKPFIICTWNRAFELVLIKSTQSGNRWTKRNKTGENPSQEKVESLSKIVFGNSLNDSYVVIKLDILEDFKITFLCGTRWYGLATMFSLLFSELFPTATLSVSNNELDEVRASRAGCELRGVYLFVASSAAASTVRSSTIKAGGSWALVHDSAPGTFRQSLHHWLGGNCGGVMCPQGVIERHYLFICIALNAMGWAYGAVSCCLVICVERTDQLGSSIFL